MLSKDSPLSILSKGFQVLCFLTLVLTFCFLPTQFCSRFINDPSLFGLFLTGSKEWKTSWSFIFSYFFKMQKQDPFHTGIIEYTRRVLGNRQEFRNVFWSVSLCIPFFLSELPCLFQSPWGVFQIIVSTTLHILYLFIPSMIQAILVCGNIGDPVKRIVDEKKPGFLLCSFASFLSWPGADWIPVLLLYLPVELKLLPKFHKPLKLPWTMLMGSTCLVLIFDMLPTLSFGEVYRRAPYSWHLTPLDWQWSIAGFIFIAVFCNIVGWELGFVEWNPPNHRKFSLVQLFRWCLLALTIFLGALPEEIFFRGIILQKLSRYFRKDFWSLLVSSLIFGIVHLKNPLDHFPLPNWRFALMATVAGFSYGWVYQQTHSVVASALTHGLTNLIWRTFLWKKSIHS
ncbi:hypothetical protein GpartN1_g5487.t1 [Galdieria partita]|uniref:CAAX prenyl protease 2/Lysostaphin resistance protein A-like domain-containing protein n=1 Tax=Galdieria partita TaxID=83374 RepID=A0A9C7Q1C0_9RHOD|nr:hypothetical protein GpartN1_g5487.t1 [Galdieria partita]